ncbi:MAG: hypothetical protein NZM12_10305 [Steroidobacteraceae bacterium]|nr:hypothetical protein [Steroidobacteraceae bacterium]MDW8259980.1 hypothetical protein [Gammaproteobacteria bacterium]
MTDIWCQIQIRRNGHFWNGYLLLANDWRQFLDVYYDAVSGRSKPTDPQYWLPAQICEFYVCSRVLSPRLLEHVGREPLSSVVDAHHSALWAQVIAQLGPWPEAGEYEIMVRPLGADLPEALLLGALTNPELEVDLERARVLFRYWHALRANIVQDAPKSAWLQWFRDTFVCRFDFDRASFERVVDSELAAFHAFRERLETRVPA